MDITIEQVCRLLNSHDNILLLTHMNPDGDTLGSAFGLQLALEKLGKQVRVECSDPFPERYDFFRPKAPPKVFSPDFIVAVDIADQQLFGAKLEPYKGRVDLCIDHHPSNTRYAAASCVRPEAGATAEVIWAVILGMGVQPDRPMATCLYTGISTDTGCFKYSNATAQTHRIAAELMDLGVDHAKIDRLMFDVKSKARIEMERRVIAGLEYFCDHKGALIYFTRQMLEETGANEAELDGLSVIPRQIEGVEVGVTLREKEEGFKVSLRTNEYLDASAICASLGGGGHVRAAGCFVSGSLEEAKRKVVAAIERAMDQSAPRQ